VTVSEVPEVEPTDFVVAPLSVYSTVKARNLAQLYEDNLASMVARVEAHPVARTLKIQNNIETAGGIGFFTHSASQPPDQRYLELAVKTPDSQGSQDVSIKAKQLFERYGSELLSILAADSAIRNDDRVAGYALNFGWVDSSTVLKTGPEKVVFYFSKEKTLAFVDGNINATQLLADPAIFHVNAQGTARELDPRAP